MAAEVMVVEDEVVLCRFLLEFLEGIGYTACGAESGEEALDLFVEARPSLVLLDIKLPDIDGLEVLQRLKEIDPTCKVVVMSSYSAVGTVVRAMKRGAETYLTKPTPLPELQVLIEHLLEKPAGGEEIVTEMEGVIGRSPAMQQVLNMVRRVANTSATVLLRGESGTGKEVIARAIHQQSPSASKAFVAIDCASIPVNLMESELFGHERGAFTDARTQKKGLMEMADGGTLFLDEIGLLPIDMQSRLLHVLESQQFRRVGGTEEISVSMRFLAATNEDLEEAVHQGRFREDLYYRLNVVPIDLPPLREREDDVLLLAEYYLQFYSSLHQRGPKRLADDVLPQLRDYAWPGNVRQLKNAVERAVLMAEGEVIAAQALVLDRRARRADATSTGTLQIDAEGSIAVIFPPQGLALDQVEQAFIQAALQHVGGNVSQAAALLHMSRDTLRYRIDKYGLDSKASRPG
jgi:two-component system NtrC family response regulator